MPHPSATITLRSGNGRTTASAAHPHLPMSGCRLSRPVPADPAPIAVRWLQPADYGNVICAPHFSGPALYGSSC